MTLLITAVLLALNAAISGQQTNNARDVKFEAKVKDATFAPRPRAAVTRAMESELYRKGYIPIGSLSLNWIVDAPEIEVIAAATVDEDGDYMLRAQLRAEIEQALMDRAATAGGDLIQMNAPSIIAVGIRPGEGSWCTESRLTSNGRDILCVRFDFGVKGACVQYHVRRKGQECVAWHVFPDPARSKKVSLAATLWRAEPDLVRGWQEYSYPDYGFSIFAPSKPVIQKDDTGDVKYVIHLAGNQTLTITIDPKPLFLDPGLFRKLGRGLLESRHYNIASDREIRQTGYYGVDLEAQGVEASAVQRVKLRYLAIKGKFVSLSHFGSQDARVLEARDRIFDSLMFLDEPPPATTRSLAPPPPTSTASPASRSLAPQPPTSPAPTTGRSLTPPPSASPTPTANRKVEAGEAATLRAGIDDWLAPKPPAPAVTAAPAAGKWQEYSYPEYGFSISAPSKPDFHKDAVGDGNYLINLAPTQQIAISINPHVTNSERDMRLVRMDIRKSLLDSNYNITSEKEITWAVHQGVEWEAQGKGGRAKVRFLRVNGKDFSLFYFGPLDMPVPAERDRIFDSLKFLADAPSSPVAKASAGPLAAAGSLPGGWQQYSYKEDGFSITTPAKPELQQGSAVKNYQIALDGNSALLISVSKTQPGDKQEPNRALTQYRDAFIKSLDVKVISEKQITLADSPGIEFEARGAKWYCKSRLYLVKGTFFNLISIAPANLPLAPETNRFFDSLTLLQSSR